MACNCLFHVDGAMLRADPQSNVSIPVILEDISTEDSERIHTHHLGLRKSNSQKIEILPAVILEVL